MRPQAGVLVGRQGDGEDVAAGIGERGEGAGDGEGGRVAGSGACRRHEQGHRNGGGSAVRSPMREILEEARREQAAADQAEERARRAQRCEQGHEVGDAWIEEIGSAHEEPRATDRQRAADRPATARLQAEDHPDHRLVGVDDAVLSTIAVVEGGRAFGLAAIDPRGRRIGLERGGQRRRQRARLPEAQRVRSRCGRGGDGADRISHDTWVRTIAAERQESGAPEIALNRA